LDGWPNRDLNVGAIVATAPNLKPFTDLLKIDEDQVRKVLLSWGPGKYDAELNQDGKAFRADGKSAATLIPAAFGLAGQNLHTYTGWGSCLTGTLTSQTRRCMAKELFSIRDSRTQINFRSPTAADSRISEMFPI
jgi:hypothetical protein